MYVSPYHAVHGNRKDECTQIGRGGRHGFWVREVRRSAGLSHVARAVTWVRSCSCLCEGNRRLRRPVKGAPLAAELCSPLTGRRAGSGRLQRDGVGCGAQVATGRLSFVKR